MQHDQPDQGRRHLLATSVMMLAGLPLGLALSSMSAMAAVPVSEKRFLWLSRRLTGQQRLNRHLMRGLLDALNSEPWGNEHLQQVLDVLAPEPLDDGLMDIPVDVGQLTDGQRWFVQHLLVSWLSGIYFHERGNHTLSYRHALMHDALQDIRPIPGICQQRFGFWQYPPA